MAALENTAGKVGEMLNNLRQRIRNRAALFDRHHVIPLQLPTAMATFTFDDFPRSAHETGGKILEAAGARATYFLVGSYMGRTVDGVEQFDEATLKAAHAAGHEIGCHTFDHKKLGSQGADFTRETCARNLKFFQQTLGTTEKMTSFAYPYGDVSLSVKNEISHHFPLCRGVRERLNSGRVDLAQVDTISLESRHAEQLDLKALVAEARAKKSWIVFLSHDVSENPSPYGSTPAMIEEAVRCLGAAGIPILTIKAAAAIIQQGTHG